MALSTETLTGVSIPLVPYESAAVADLDIGLTGTTPWGFDSEADAQALVDQVTALTYALREIRKIVKA